MGAIAQRIRALRARYGHVAKFRYIAQRADLLHQAGHLQELIEAAKAVGATLIVLDTLNRPMAGGNENGPDDMGLFLTNVSELREATGAHIAIVHHGTKSSNGTKSRGHSSLEGADDAMIEVVKADDGTRTATVVHAKDDADGFRMCFSMEKVELGTDDDGDPITTLLVKEAAEPSKTVKRERMTSDQANALKCLHVLLHTTGTVASVGPGFGMEKCVSMNDWSAQFCREYKQDLSEKDRKQAFRRASDALQASERVACRDRLVWLPGANS